MLCTEEDHLLPFNITFIEYNVNLIEKYLILKDMHKTHWPILTFLFHEIQQNEGKIIYIEGYSHMSWEMHPQKFSTRFRI